MKFKLLMIIIYSLCLTSQVLADSWILSVPKKSIVVLKIPKSAFGFTNVSLWSGRSNYETYISQTSDQLQIKGDSQWRDSDWNLMTELVLKDVKVNKKQKITEVSLENNSLKIKLNFDSSVTNIAKSFDEICFVGTLLEYERSDYYKREIVAKFVPKIFSGRLASIPETFKLHLLKASNYETKNYGDEDFKGKYYFVVRDAANTYFNSVRLSQPQRVSYVFNNYLLNGFKEMYRNLKDADIDGVKIEYQIPYYNFVSKSDEGIDKLHIYVQMEDIKTFAEADITGQELLDKSIVLINSNRSKVDLTQQ